MIQEQMGPEFTTQGEVYKNEAGVSSSKCPDYSQLHIRSMARIAAVYEEGAAIHGRDNWLKGDAKFVRERLNHCLQHLKLWDEGDRTMDHLAKVGWFADMAMELERLGKLDPRPPEWAEEINKELDALEGKPSRSEILDEMNEDEKKVEKPWAKSLMAMIGVKKP